MKKHRILLAVIILTTAFLISATINLNSLFNYAYQPIPSYITKDNTEGNPITNEGATLGRVLFYDKKLSSNNQVACASCHKQEFAFGEPNGMFQTFGVNGHVLKNPPRLINIRFSDEKKMFWNERAANLEQLATMPIKDHIEMGYSGTMGDQNFSDLLNKMNLIPYYHELFTLAFGDPSITEDRMKKAIAQFLRSIQSFDSKYDAGRNVVASDNVPFPNFSTSENN
jgi:cytochrome c peroxidase